MADRTFSSMQDFARFAYDLLHSDRDCVIAVGGFTGEGKSCWSTQLQMTYSKIAGLPWSFHDNITWSHDEFMTWIDGKGDKKEGQKPEYSGILPDELITMFYRRNWHQDPQIEAIRLLNMCRDRHLLIVGNIPNFFDLDSAFAKRIRYYVYIPERGKAWVFEQENNPFSADPWNINDNRKLFRKMKKPYGLPNFVCEIPFNDWTERDKKAYYEVRNTKRVGSEKQHVQFRNARFEQLVSQRDKLMRLLHEKYKVSQKALGEITGLSSNGVHRALTGENQATSRDSFMERVEALI